MNRLPEVFAVWDPLQRGPRVDLYIQDTYGARYGQDAIRIHPFTQHHEPYGRPIRNMQEGIIEEIHWNHNPQFYALQVELDQYAPLKTVFACNTSLVVRAFPHENHWNNDLGDPIPLFILWAPPFTFHARPPEKSIYIQNFARWESPLTEMWHTMRHRFHLPEHPQAAIYELFEDWTRERERRRERRERRRQGRRGRVGPRYESDSEEEFHQPGAAGGGRVPVLIPPPVEEVPVLIPPPAAPVAPQPKPAPAERIALALARDFVASKEVCPITQDPLKAGRIAVTACNCVFQAEGLETWASSHTTCPSCRTELSFRIVSVS